MNLKRWTYTPVHFLLFNYGPEGEGLFCIFKLYCLSKKFLEATLQLPFSFNNTLTIQHGIGSAFWNANFHFYGHFIDLCSPLRLSNIFIICSCFLRASLNSYSTLPGFEMDSFLLCTEMLNSSDINFWPGFDRSLYLKSMMFITVFRNDAQMCLEGEKIERQYFCYLQNENCMAWFKMSLQFLFTFRMALLSILFLALEA